MIRLSMACVDGEEIESIKQVFEDGAKFGLGRFVGEFEADLAEFVGGDREVICVNTGTSALHIALEAMNFPRGAEVIVPSITYLASFSAISAAGLKPVACDILLPSGHIDPEDCGRRINSKTVAIMPIAYAGVDFARKEIYELAKINSLRVIEDDAHAFGADTSNGKKFGSEGDVVCFSFDGIKNITCGEGGAVFTSDLKLANTIRVMRSLGVEKDVELRYKGSRAWEFDAKVQGFRYHMSNINAAIGRTQLRKIAKFFEIKSEILMLYHKLLDEHGLFEIVPTQQFRKENFLHIFNCLLPSHIDRGDVRTRMLSLGVETGVHYQPNHSHTLYASDYALPNSDLFGRHTLTLPFHANLSKDDIERIISTLKSCLIESEALTSNV
ncbi:MAG: DegT/DnrJ/EryC1/StrS family aminotransferase [Sphingobacteriales bacterium]|nr:MAG: DegT/DnrJ/EryC1/StrS family aminotransferase [Sphingobacteriales bacterium]